MVAIVLWAGGCDIAVRRTVRRLTDAGFAKRPADTVGKLDDLTSMTQHRVVRRVREGVPWFAYADAKVTEALYIGDGMAYARYKSIAVRTARTVTDQLEPIEGKNSRIDWRVWDPLGRP